MGNEVTSYNGGETYQISLTVLVGSGTPGGYDFQLTMLDGSDSDVANFSNPSTNAKISISSIAVYRRYAEHTSASVSNIFTFDWKAPSGGTGNLTLYYNVNAVDGTGGTAGDNGGAGYTSSINENSPIVKVLGALEINNAFTFPIIDRTANQVLTTDGAGTVSRMDVPSAISGGSNPSQSLRSLIHQTPQNHLQKADIDALKNEVILLKSEIEILKKLIDKLPVKKE